MEQKKQEVLNRISELNKVKNVRPTAMNLHSQNPMLTRVGRQESARYIDSVNKQKAKLKGDLNKIESYLESVKSNRRYINNAPVVIPKPVVNMNKNIGKGNNYGQGNNSVQGNNPGQESYEMSFRKNRDYLMNTPSIIPMPEVTVGIKPVMGRTRLQRMRNRRRGRY